MRGKAIVGGLALLSLGVLAFGLWFLGSRSPIDERFNLKRQAITSNAPQSQLLPERVGYFLRRSLTPISRNTANQLEGSASYSDADHKQIWLVVRSPGDQQSAAGALVEVKGDFKFHRDTPFPYGFGATPSGYTFVWINDGWLITAYSSETDAETLLQFVNGYPF